MKQLNTSPEQLAITKYLLKWTLLVLPVSIVAGSLVALFLWLLEKATDYRLEHPWLLYLLPLAGIFIYWLYKQWGQQSAAGNNLIIDEIHQPGGGVPARMTPLILITTVITHLFGGSAGREGTAVQIGGSVAQYFASLFRLSKEDISILLTTGIAAGFGAVFGTPVTGAIFALEVLAIGRIKHKGLLPCLMAAVLADFVCSAWGIHHTKYTINYITNTHIFDGWLLLKVIGASIAFGLCSFMFASTTHTIQHYSNRFIAKKWLIPVAGACILILFTWILQTDDYLGLGVSNPDPNAVTIVTSFHENGATNFSWLWKLLFTAITLGTGFKGGEVTPLFFIGAALGNTIAIHTGAPVDLLAGLGFIAVFAGATNTPIACTVMGVELFGADNVLYYAVACFTAYYFSGHSGIYGAQRVAVPKSDIQFPFPTLRDKRKK
ncbi:voltage-gated chloride channel protein [Chitinophaga silvatica]|uniref:Voltage-gated chloride channel protein n=1 Tax=Chitinophaga silvatica TaxID=2282649 RepID=A0A3E1YHY9_9BACT|nr:voltage-gated chloride channel family protein [Chitinophaga silvatica]RFS26954.1 voltage-gated chloride channel protein [Chitinophaga silvatica]